MSRKEPACYNLSQQAIQEFHIFQQEINAAGDVVNAECDLEYFVAAQMDILDVVPAEDKVQRLAEFDGCLFAYAMAEAQKAEVVKHVMSERNANRSPGAVKHRLRKVHFYHTPNIKV